MKKVLHYISSFAVAATLLSMSASLAAQTRVPRMGQRALALSGDSVQVHYAVPDSAGKRPVILVLHDRFGLQPHIQAVLRVLGSVGYRAFALPLSSAAPAPVVGIPPVVFDSTDIVRVAQAAVELHNEEECNGSIALLGFDIGAAVAAELTTRFPFFRAAALFYPSGGTTTLLRLPFSLSPLLLCIASDDPECSSNDVVIIREIFLDEGRRLDVRRFADTQRFFFNPEHENYYVPAMKNAWQDTIRFFNQWL